MPDFLLIGSMKSGSTSLHDHLVRHPQLAEPKHKEPGFFSRDDRFARGLPWYQSLFDQAEPGQRCFESSTCYSRWPHFGDVAARIHEHLPDIQLLFIMRHPVERAYSHYRHAMLEREHKGTGPVVSFDAVLEESEEYFDTSCYLRQLEQYLRFYPRERLFLLTLDELRTDTEGTLTRVQEFLGLDLDPALASKSGGPSNKIEARALRSNTMRTAERVKSSSLIQLARAVVPQPVRAGVRDLIFNSPLVQYRMNKKAEAFAAKLSPLTDATRARLLDRFEAPNRDLERFWDRELPPKWYR